MGSIFELINQNPIFGVIGTDSPLYLPVLGTFAVTGFPTTGALAIAVPSVMQLVPLNSPRAFVFTGVLSVGALAHAQAGSFSRA